MSNEGEVHSNVKVVEGEKREINLNLEVEKLKAEIESLKSLQSINSQIKKDAEEQEPIIRAIPNPAIGTISEDERAEQIYNEIINKNEELRYTNGISKKYCLREHGIDRLDTPDGFEYKVLLMHQESQLENSSCTKEDIIRMIKNNMRR